MWLEIWQMMEVAASFGVTREEAAGKWRATLLWLEASGTRAVFINRYLHVPYAWTSLRLNLRRQRTQNDRKPAMISSKKS